VKANTTRTMQIPGGAKYHHAPSPGAPTDRAASSSWPQDGWNGSPRPTNDSVVSVSTAPANVRIAFATMRFTTFGRMCRRMMWPLPPPTTRARSTNARSFSDSVWERMIRAVDDQLVMPMTTTMTISVIRMPKTSRAAEPTSSRMIGVRIRARTNVGMTRKKSVIRMRIASVVPPTNPATIPTTTPIATVTIVARKPMTSEIRAPWTVRFSMSRPSSSVPSG
jgi:hypothetical protein